MSQVVVGISDMKVSTNPDEELITYSLGSCLGIAVYDPIVKVGGMMHCMLPMAGTNREKAKAKPYMFVDTGMVTFIKELFDIGVTKKNAVIKVCGGARVLDTKDLFRIGERNFTVFRKVMWKNGLMIAAQDVGGSGARTMSLEMVSGKVMVKNNGQFSELT